MVYALRFLKFMTLGLFASGVIGCLWARCDDDCRRFAYALAGPGFAGTWLVGFGLAYATRQSLLSTWILGAMVSSFVALQVVLYAAGKPARRSFGLQASGIILFMASIVFMVWRPS